MFGLPLAWIPNTTGFRFVGIRRDRSRVECVVTRDVTTGLHSVEGFADLIGWERIPAAKK